MWSSDDDNDDGVFIVTYHIRQGGNWWLNFGFTYPLFQMPKIGLWPEKKFLIAYHIFVDTLEHWIQIDRF